jgi:hypothetical protein
VVVLDSVRASVRDSVWASVGDSVRASVRASVRDSVWASVRASVGGQHDANWLGFYEYFAVACGLSRETQKLCGLWEVSQSAGWWLPHEKTCWISDRHNILNRNDEGRLHCEDGPALCYPDGWCIWAISGVLVDKEIVMQPERQSVKQIRSEENEEVRRIRIERFGWPRYLNDISAKVVELRRNDIDKTDEALMRGDNMTVLVCACPSTGRIYGMEVPNDVETCNQAQNWLRNSSEGFLIGAS